MSKYIIFKSNVRMLATSAGGPGFNSQSRMFYIYVTSV